MGVSKSMKNNNNIVRNNNGLKVIDFFMLGLGAMIGVGWTVSLNDWFQTAGGVFGTILAFLIGTLMVIPIGLCYGELTSAIPVSGGVMAFAYRANGSKLSFLGGWLNALAYVVLLPWEMIYINHVLSLLFPVLASGKPLYIIFGFPVYLGELVVGILLTAIIVILNLKGAEISGIIQTGFTSMILIAAVFIAVFSFIKADFNNLLPVYTTIEGQKHNNFLSGFIGMLVLVPFFMAGFDAIPQAIEDANEGIKPKTISKILVFTIASAGMFYILIILAAASAFPWKEFASLETPALAFMFYRLYGKGLGSFLYYITIIGSLGGLLSTYNGMFIAATRLLFSMGRSRLLPERFSKKSKADMPYVAILFCGGATLIGPFFGESVIRPLTNVGSLAFVLGWLITCYATFKLRKTEPDLNRPIEAGKGDGIIIISIVISAILALLLLIPGSPGFMSYGSLAIFIGWLILGEIFYNVSQKKGKTITEKERFELMFNVSE